MRSRDIAITKEMDMSFFENSIDKQIPCSVWIDKEMDETYVVFSGVDGGYPYHISSNKGLLISEIDGNYVVVGFLISNLLSDIEKNDENELQLRKSRYYDGEEDDASDI